MPSPISQQVCGSASGAEDCDSDVNEHLTLIGRDIDSPHARTTLDDLVELGHSHFDRPKAGVKAANRALMVVELDDSPHDSFLSLPAVERQTKGSHVGASQASPGIGLQQADGNRDESAACGLERINGGASILGEVLADHFTASDRALLLTGSARSNAASPKEEADPGHADSAGDGERLLMHSHQRAFTYSDALEVDMGQGIGGDADGVDEAIVMQKVNRHLIWRISLLCFLNYLDRTNLSFAAVTMKKDLGLSDYQYGVGSSAFFLGYCLFQVPFTYIMVRVGAPAFLAVSLIAWGIFATSFGAVHGVVLFYLLRVLLGIAESGTFPGTWWHLTQWYTEEEVGFSYSYTSAVIAGAQVLGGPLAAAFLQLDGVLGLAGWRWLFLLEGIPTILLGLYFGLTLPSGPLHARFLSPAERQWLHNRQMQRGACALRSSPGTTNGSTSNSQWGAIFSWKVYALGAMDGMCGTAKFGIIYWAPLLISAILGGRPGTGEPSLGANQQGDAGEFTPSPAVIVLLAAIPFGVAAVFTLGNAYHSKRSGERRMHIILPTVVAAVGLGILAVVLESHPVLGFTALTMASLVFAPTAVQSSYPASFLKGPASALGWAAMNMTANTGGLLGPYLIGAVKKLTGRFEASIAALAAITTLAAICYAIVLPHVAPDPRELARSTVPQAAHMDNEHIRV